ncbi:MAG: hypothetical protein R3F59_34015 [Myxococcota bacterium]
MVHHTPTSCTPAAYGRDAPSELQVFDADRVPLSWDGAGFDLDGVRIGLEVPEQACAVAQ